MEFQEIETDVTPGISRTSLWAIIVILLIVVGIESIVILNMNNEAEDSSAEAGPQLQQQQQTSGDALGLSKGLGQNSANFPTQPPNSIPTLLPTRVPANSSTNQTKKTTINRTYSFPIKDPSGADLDDNYEFVLKDYEVTNKVTVNNFYNATVTGDKKILAVNIELNNNTDRAFKIIARDYLRLSVDQGKWIAPEIHNDPVEVRPQSSKTTVVGFPLNKNVKSPRLQVGELEGEKEIFELTGV